MRSSAASTSSSRVVDRDHEAVRLLGARHVARAPPRTRAPGACRAPRATSGRCVGVDRSARRCSRACAQPTVAPAEPLDLGARVIVLRVLEQRALHPHERELAVADALLRDLGDAVHRRDALFASRLTLRSSASWTRDQLVPGVLHPVERLEDLADRRRARRPASNRSSSALQRAARARAPRRGSRGTARSRARRRRAGVWCS